MHRQLSRRKLIETTLQQAFFEVLGTRYVMYDEWVYAKHTVFYDKLPHYFLEFDVLDRQTGRFLDTPSRCELLTPLAAGPGDAFLLPACAGGVPWNHGDRRRGGSVASAACPLRLLER